jgi:hypothetical protein
MSSETYSKSKAVCRERCSADHPIVSSSARSDQVGINNCSRQPIASPAGVIRRSGVFVFGPAWSRIKERKMSLQQAQIDALESLLIALIKNNQMSTDITKVFADAHSRIMSESGPAGTAETTEAASYLEHLKTVLR